MIPAILQARMSSTRLPGKVLRPILGVPMLARQIERLRRAEEITVVVATSDEGSDDPIADLCASLSVPCSRGSLTDVLDRFYRAALPLRPEHVVRVTGDCPLVDPGLVDRTVIAHRAEDFDYTSTALERTFPDGLDVEVMRFSALSTAWEEATEPEEREHVTPFLYRNPDRFDLGVVRSAVDRSHLHWSVDVPEDLALVTAIYEELHPVDPEFTTEDVLALLERRPDLRELNARVSRSGSPASRPAELGR